MGLLMGLIQTNRERPEASKALSKFLGGQRIAASAMHLSSHSGAGKIAPLGDLRQTVKRQSETFFAHDNFKANSDQVESTVEGDVSDNKKTRATKVSSV